MSVKCFSTIESCDIFFLQQSYCMNVIKYVMCLAHCLEHIRYSVKLNSFFSSHESNTKKMKIHLDACFWYPVFLYQNPKCS